MELLQDILDNTNKGNQQVQIQLLQYLHGQEVFNF